MTNTIKTLILAATALPLAACATPYTGPVEVTRFVAEDFATATTIGTRVNRDAEGGLPGSLYEQAVADELSRLSYVVNPANSARQSADIRVSRYRVDSVGRRSPVSVGVGGGTGTFGSGVGLGVGINLGGGAKPRELTELSVRISGANNTTLWEGRAEMVTSTDSALGDPATNARALARALFSSFPGNNGETIQVDAQ